MEIEELTSAVVENRSKAGMEELAAWVDDDPDRFSLAWEVMESGEDRPSECAAWMIFHCLKRWPHLIIPHQHSALSMLKGASRSKTNPYHDAVHRTLLTGLTPIELEPELQLPIYDLAVAHIGNQHAPAAIRCHSIFLAWSIAEGNPDLQYELAIMIETNLATASSGFKNRGKKILRAIQKD